MKKNIKSVLKLKEIPSVDYDFDDVIKNTEKLLDYDFPDNAELIRQEVSSLASKYVPRIRSDYDKYLVLANRDKKLTHWNRPFTTALKSGDIQFAVLDLYLQINLVVDWDVYNDVLIHTYLEDIQPYL